MFEKWSWTHFIFGLFQTWFLMPVLPAKFKFEIDQKIKFIRLDFLNLIFIKSESEHLFNKFPIP